MKHKPDPGAPLSPHALETIAQQIFERLPGCTVSGCVACAANMRHAREFAKAAFELGREDTANAPLLCLFGHECHAVCEICESDLL